MHLIGSLLGFRRRNRSGASVLLLIIGLFACVSGCPLAAFGAPYSLYRSRQVAALPRPGPEQLPSISPGTSILLRAQVPQVPIEVSTSSHGLALYYIEERQPSTQQEAGTPTSGSKAPSWKIKQPPPPTMEMHLADGSASLTVQISPKPSFLNAQKVEGPSPTTESSENNENNENNEDDSQAEYRYTGYLPGQTLTIEGAWEGNNRLTGQTFYAGTPDDYIYFLTYTQPGMALLMGFVCSSLGLILLVVGGGLRILGR